MFRFRPPGTFRAAPPPDCWSDFGFFFLFFSFSPYDVQFHCLFFPRLAEAWAPPFSGVLSFSVLCDVWKQLLVSGKTLSTSIPIGVFRLFLWPGSVNVVVTAFSNLDGMWGHLAFAHSTRTTHPLLSFPDLSWVFSRRSCLMGGLDKYDFSF